MSTGRLDGAVLPRVLQPAARVVQHRVRPLKVLQHELFLRRPLLEQLLAGAPLRPVVLQEQPLHEGVVGGAGEERLLVEQPEEAAAVGRGEVGLARADASLFVNQRHHRGGG